MSRPYGSTITRSHGHALFSAAVLSLTSIEGGRDTQTLTRVKMPITPLSSSSSPTPPLSSSSSSYFSRHSDAPSSSKKRKLNSSPYTSRFTPASTPDPQLDAARRAASNRILNVWSSLEQKYACRLDEDDIVDLRTVSVIKDRGVLSSTENVFDFGCFSEHNIKDAEYEGTEQEEEDELGILGSDIELDRQFSRVCLPVKTRVDPADADDLEEFLVAEEFRKKLHRASTAKARGGDEKEEGWEDSEGEEEEPGGEGDLVEDEVQVEQEGAEEKEEERRADDEEGEEEEEGKEKKSSDEDGEVIDLLEAEDPNPVPESDVEHSPRKRDLRVKDSPAPSPDESEDELAGYDDTVGEGAMLWEVARPSGSARSKLSPSKLGLQYFQSPRTEPIPLTPRRASTSQVPLFKTPRSSKKRETPSATSLTPLTQQLSLDSKPVRADSVSPTKRLVAEVLVPRFKKPMLQLGKDKSALRRPLPFDKDTSPKPERLTEKIFLKRKRSSLSDSRIISSDEECEDETRSVLISRTKNGLRVSPEAEPKTSVGTSTSSPSSGTQSVHRSSSPLSFAVHDHFPSSHLSVSSQEDKPPLPHPTPQYALIPPFIPTSIPAYSPYIPPPPPPDWGMHYQQNQTQSMPSYSPDPRYYIAQAMHSLSLLFNPVQAGNSQTPWPYSLPAPSAAPSEVSRSRTPWPTLSFPMSYPGSPNKPIDGTTQTISPANEPSSSAQPVVPKSCLKKVSFSPVPTQSSSTSIPSRDKSHSSEQTSPTSRLRPRR